MSKDTIDHWQRLVNEHIPLSKHLAFTLKHLSDERCETESGLEPNLNIHNSAFAGSLYSLCTLTAWTYINFLLDEAKLTKQVVLAKASIDYRRPVIGAINCQCELKDQERNTFFNLLKTNEQASIELTVIVTFKDKSAVLFQGEFVALPSR